MIGCVLCAKFKATPIPRERKSPLNIETKNFVNELEISV